MTKTGNFLCKNMSQIGLPVFLHSTILPNPLNPMLYNAFQLARHPENCPSREAIYTLCNTCSLNPPDSASQPASRLVQQFLHSSWQKVPMPYNAVHFAIKKLIAAINVIKRKN